MLSLSEKNKYDNFTPTCTLFLSHKEIRRWATCLPQHAYLCVAENQHRHPHCYFCSRLISQNHNLIKELPKVKYEEEGKSGFNFLSQSSVWTIMAFTCWDNSTNTAASRNEQCWPTVCTIAAVQIGRPFWPDLSNVNTERSLPLLVDSHSFPLGLKGYRGAGQ